jgi:hypothetical protein
MQLNDSHSTGQRSWPHAATTEPQRKSMAEWILQRFSVSIVAGCACAIRELARRLCHKACLAWSMGRADPRRSAIVSACGINRDATQHHRAVDIAARFRGDHFRVVSLRNLQNSGNFSESGCDKKKIAALDAFRIEKPGKTQVHGGQSVPEPALNGAKATTIDIHWPGRVMVPFLQTEALRPRNRQQARTDSRLSRAFAVN